MTIGAVTDTVAVVTDYQELAAAIRQRITELDISQETVENLAGIPSGYLAKITSNPPLRRQDGAQVSAPENQETNS
jgi:hypothetical protein